MKSLRYMTVAVIVFFYGVVLSEYAYAGSKPKVLYVKAYNLFEKAKVNSADKKLQQAKKNYFFALNILEGLKEDHSNWHRKEVDWLVNEIQKQILVINNQPVGGKKSPEIRNDKEIKRLEAEISALKEKNAALVNSVKELDSLLSKKESEVKLMADNMVSFGVKESSLKEEIAQKDKLIAEYQADNTESKKLLAETSAQLDKCQVALTQAQDIENELNKSILDSNAALKHIENEYALYKESVQSNKQKDLKEFEVKQLEKENKIIALEGEIKASKSNVESLKQSLQQSNQQKEQLNSLVVDLKERIRVSEEQRKQHSDANTMEISHLKSKHQKAMHSLEQSYADKIALAEKADSEKIKILKKENEAYLMQLKSQSDEHQKQLIAIKYQNDTAVSYEQTKNTELKTKNSELSSKLNMLNKDKQRLIAARDELSSKFKDIDLRLSKANQENQMLGRQNEEYKNKMESQNKDLSLKDDKIASLATVYAEIEQAKTKLEKQTLEMSGENQRLTADIDALKKDNGLLKEKIAVIEKQILDQGRTAEQKQNQLTDVEARINELTSRSELLRKQNKDSAEEISLLLESNNKYKQEISQFTATIAALESKLKKTEDSEFSLSEVAKEKEQKLFEVEQQDKVLKNKISQLEETLKAYANDEVLEKNQLQELSLQLREKEQQIEALRKEKSNVLQSRIDKDKQLDNKQKQIDVLEKKNQNLESDVTSKENLLETNKQQLAEITANIDDLQKEIKMIQVEKQKVLESNAKLMKEKELLLSQKEDTQAGSSEAVLQEIRQQHTQQIKTLNENYMRNKAEMIKKIDTAEAKILDLESSNRILEKNNKKLEVLLSLKKAENN